MGRLILDNTDLNILATLSRDCRISYSSIGSQIGLTSKSVKIRVKNMVCCGIIEKFIVRVNPGSFGYKIANVLVIRNKGIAKDYVIERIKQFGDLAFHAHHMGRTSMAAVIIKESVSDKFVQSLNDYLHPTVVKGMSVCCCQVLEQIFLKLRKYLVFLKRPQQDA